LCIIAAAVITDVITGAARHIAGSTRSMLCTSSMLCIVGMLCCIAAAVLAGLVSVNKTLNEVQHIACTPIKQICIPIHVEHVLHACCSAIVSCRSYVFPAC
jgi:hypothetical protein